MSSCSTNDKYYPNSNNECSNTCTYYIDENNAYMCTNDKCTDINTEENTYYRYLDSDGRYICKIGCNTYIDDANICLENNSCPYYYVDTERNVRVCMYTCNPTTRYTELYEERQEMSLEALRCETSCAAFGNKQYIDIVHLALICTSQCNHTNKYINVE